MAPEPGSHRKTESLPLCLLAENICTGWTREKERALERFSPWGEKLGQKELGELDKQVNIWLGISAETPITPESFVPYLQQVSNLLSDPNRALAGGVDFLNRLIDNRKIPLTGDDVNFLATYLFSHEINDWQRLMNNGATKPLINIWIKGLPEYYEANIALPWPRWLTDGWRHIYYHQWCRGEVGPEKYPRSNALTLSAEIEQLLGTQKVVEVLDVGMGTGFWLEKIKSHFGDRVRTTGVTMTSSLKWGSTVDTAHYGPAEILPPGWTNLFDLIVSHKTFMYITHPLQAVSEIMRVLKPGGRGHLSLQKYFNPPPTLDYMGSLHGMDTKTVMHHIHAYRAPLVDAQTQEEFVHRAAEMAGCTVQPLPGSACSFYKTS